jgi:putative hemolysin
MTGSPGLDLFFFLTSLIFATVIAVAEFAITSASRSRLEPLAERGERDAVRALALKDRDEDVQGATQIAILFLTIFAALLLAPHAESAVQEVLRSGVLPWLLPLLRLLAFLITAIVMTGVFLVTVNLVAKSLGERYADALVLRVAGGVYTLSRILHLPQLLLTFIANILLRPFRGEASFRESVTSEENLMDILEDGAKTGLLDRTEHELIESIFQFTDTTAREVMIPRTDVVAVDLNTPASGILERFLEEGFTRMPVYRDSLDAIEGVIYAKDVISLIQHPDLIILQDIIRPAFIVPETKPISELLREFQFKRLHMAIVVDEFGGTEGLITMEDILEEIVGEIRDEYDDEEIPYVLLPGGGIEVEAMVNISDFNNFTDISIPESEDYDTMGGFVTTLFGRIPEAGDRILFDQLSVQVVEADERRVTRVRIIREEQENGRNNGD